MATNAKESKLAQAARMHEKGDKLAKIVEKTGLYDFEVAAATGMSDEAIRRMERKHVLRLRKAGKTRPEMMEELGLTDYRINLAMGSLFEAGAVSHKQHGRTADEDRNKKIIKLRRAGKTNEQIAEILGESLGLVANRISVLAQAGRLELRRPGAREGVAHHFVQRKEKQKAEYLALMTGGEVMTIKKAAAKMGVSYATAKTYNKELIAEGKLTEGRLSA